MSENTVASAAPFESAAGMADATNYADWTFSLFSAVAAGAVLEVGCGVGTFTKRLAQAPLITHILSIDVSNSAVSVCRDAVRSPKLELRHADVRDVSGTFDLVVCMNVLEHIEDDLGALSHMVRLLRPGGVLFLLVPAHQFLYTPFDRESGHYRRYSRRHMHGLMRRAAMGEGWKLRQFYFNSIGALGYYAVYKLLGRAPRADSAAEIGWFDRYVVPVQRLLEPRAIPFGISLVSVLHRQAQP